MSQTSYRSDLPQLPKRMQRLPLDDRGYPVPWFVDWLDGKPVFQAMDPQKFQKAIQQKRCWLCGERLGVYMAFVIGPMCGVNRVSSEPPCHRDCAEYAVRACPFLTRPLARRNLRGIDPADVKRPAGVMIERNPGVSLLWITKSYKPFHAPNGILIRIGEAVDVSFWSQGRKASIEEIRTSVDSGLPILEGMAKNDGPSAESELSHQVTAFEQLLTASV